MRPGLLRFVLAILLLSMGRVGWAADNAPFDLAGPPLRVTITRGARTLPVGAVPNLAVGDKVAIKAELARQVRRRATS